MEKVRVQSFQSRVEQSVTRSSVQLESLKKRGIEVHRCHKVTIPQTRVELEDEKDKERGEGEFNRTTTLGPGVGNSIAKAHKLLEQEVIAASLGRIV